MATLILKATEQCNANCYYCDVVRKADTGHKMSLEVVETLFARVNEYLNSQNDERVELLWHGGEPLLMGPRFYESVLELQQKHCNVTKQRIRHSIQTNLTVFSERYVDILRRMGVTSVGTSFDPEPRVRGLGKEIDTLAYNRRFLKALRILETNGFGWGMIYVVTRRNLKRPLDIFHFLMNLKLSGGVNFNPVLIYDQERRDIAISADEFAEFLGVVFEYWWKHRQRFPDVQPFRSLVETIMEGRPSMGCADSGDCTYHHLNVAPNGETSQCGRAADWGLLSFGNIKDKPLYELLRDRQRDTFVRRLDVLRQGECKECRFWNLCHGGCPLDAYSKHASFMHKSEWCASKRRFLLEYFQPITGVTYAGCNG